MMEWKMEWNSEHTKLQLSCVTGTAQSMQDELPNASLGLLSHRRGFMTKYITLHKRFYMYPSVVLLLAYHQLLL